MKRDLVRLIWREQKNIITIFISFVVINMVFSIAVLTPLASKNEEKGFALLEAQEELRGKNADREKIQSPLRKFQLLEQQVEKFRLMLPAKKEFTSFLTELYRIAAKSDLEIDSVSYSADTIEGTGVLAYGFSFSLVGEYSQLRDFISSTEKSDYLIMIEKLGLRTGNNDGGTIDFQVTMKVYFADEESK